jgi:Cu/Ag efflux protein CusF
MKTFAFAIVAAIGFCFAFLTAATAQHGHESGQPMQGDMRPGGEPGHGEKHADTIEGKGVVNSVDTGNHSVNLSHEPIAAIGWPSMTMDMKVAEDVAISEIKGGESVTFTLERGPDGIYTITDIAPAP